MSRRNPLSRYTFAMAGATALGFGLLAGTPCATADPAADAAAIDARYAEFGGAGTFLGEPLGPVTEVDGGAERDYQGGYIYYSPATGAKVLYGDIAARYRALGGPAGPLGFPTDDESPASDGVGRFNEFAAPGGAAIIWQPQAGAQLVRGPILTAWKASGDVTGPFGYPAADTTTTNDTDTTRFTGPGGTEMTWSPTAGLTTTPAELGTTLPGYHVPGAPTAPAAGTSTNSGINRWWGIPIGLAIAAAVGGLMSMIGRQRAGDPLVGRPVTTPGPVTVDERAAVRPEVPPVPERPTTYRSTGVPTDRPAREKPRITQESVEDVPFSYDHKTLGDQDR